MESAATQLAKEYWKDHKRDILYNIDDSYLDGYDEFNTEMQFRNAAKVSITYMLMSRCGLEPEAYLEPEDFMPVFDFNTPAAVAALCSAVSEISQQVLRQIEVAIRNYERERSQNHDRMQSFPRRVTKRSGSRFIKPTRRCFCARRPWNSGKQGSINRKNSTATQGAAEREPFDQSGVWGASPQQAAGRFPVTEISLSACQKTIQTPQYLVK